MDLKVQKKYENYPPKIKPKMLKLRKLIVDIASNDNEIDYIGETLKWGEPSFLTQSSGSTLRIDWKEKNPDNISLFVSCSSKLISIFKEFYPDDFEYIGNREVRLPINKRYSAKKVATCVEIAFKYNLIKDQF